MECIILAAGYSSRFGFDDESYKKFMLPFKKSNILNYVIAALFQAGIQKFNIVTDELTNRAHIKDVCVEFLEEQLCIDSSQVQMDFIINDDIDRENGYSLYLGVNNVNSDSFILTMADHMFSHNIYSLLKENYEGQDVVLATDPMKKEGIYDLDDCTKVLGDNSRILEIGKKIPEYNRLDMGVFVMKSQTIKKLAAETEENQKKFGVSDVLLKAINNDYNVQYYDLPNLVWLDVDNHIEYDKLKRFFGKTANNRPFNLDFSKS